MLGDEECMWDTEGCRVFGGTQGGTGQALDEELQDGKRYRGTWGAAEDYGGAGRKMGDAG